MQFDSRHRQEILDGEVTITFRRWKRRQAIAGNRYRTSLGMVEVDAVDIVDPADVTGADARRAGSGSVDELLHQITGDIALPLYRVEFHIVDEPDPRAVLASNDSMSVADVVEIGLTESLEVGYRLSPRGRAYLEGDR